MNKLSKTRLNSISVVGGAFGDEGKGKIVDEVGNILTRRFGKVVVYRWNGGSNAGHTVELKDKKIVLHQIPSGALVKGATCILGKGMVVHPGDLIEELKTISENIDFMPNIMVDEMVPLTLDTHRAFELMLKKREGGGAGSTGRGISPAYADVVYRHPLRARDLLSKDWQEKFEKHYLLYRDLISGLGGDLSLIKVNTMSGIESEVGSKRDFINNIALQRQKLESYIKNVYDFVEENWNTNTPFIFEGAQGVGLDLHWGVYPDVTASDPTPSGIYRSTEGVVDPNEIEIRANVLKATYTSSVGKRILPTKMDEKNATRIRDDANEYGSTTKRPRDIYHIDIPSLSYFARVSNATHMILTHMDVCYIDTPVKVCIDYSGGKDKSGHYRPDQKYLDGISPVYKNFQQWDGAKIRNATEIGQIPEEAKEYINFLSRALNLKCLMITTGPKRESVIGMNYLLLS